MQQIDHIKNSRLIENQKKLEEELIALQEERERDKNAWIMEKVEHQQENTSIKIANEELTKQVQKMEEMLQKAN